MVAACHLRRAGPVRRGALGHAGRVRSGGADAACGPGGHRHRSADAGAVRRAPQSGHGAGRPRAARRGPGRRGRAALGSGRLRPRPGRDGPAPAHARPGALERPLRRTGPRAGRGADRGVAVQRARQLGATHDPPRRPARDRAVRAAHLLPGPPGRADPERPRAGRAADPLRLRRDRARPGPAAAARPGPAPARRRLAVAAPPGSARGAGGRRTGALPGRAVAAGGRGARQRAALVELRRVDLPRERQGDHLRLDSPLRPARLAARRHDPAERQGRSPALLEGGDARHLRRRALDARALQRRDAAAAGRARPPVAGQPLGLLRVEPEVGRGRPLHRALAVDQPARLGGHAVRDRGRRAGFDLERRHHPDGR